MMNSGYPRLLKSLAHLLLGLCLLLSLSVLAGGTALVAHAASAATTTVSTCDESHLDAALASASSGDTITFSCSGDIALTQTLTIDKNLTLDGSGQTVTLDGQNKVQVMLVNYGVSFTLNALTIAHGSNQPGGGGGIYNSGTLTISNSTLSNNSAQGGGGIYNSGTLTISNSTLSNNSAQGGGGILSYGTLTISNSTLSNNSAQGGGGISNGGTMTISNSTLSNNSATSTGGGIQTGGTMTISNSTLSNNSASQGGGIFTPGGGTTGAAGNIFANDSGGNCSGPLSDSGYNLSSDGSCGFTNTGSMQNTDPRLDPNGLQNNGGPTQTIALQQGSPAIDQIPVASCPATDQRGMTRPDNRETTCDIGAYEFQDDAPLTLTHFVASPLGHRSAGVVATFTDADPAGQVSDYTATVSWGDGTASTVKVYKNPLGKGFALATAHTYSKTGTYTLILTVTDQGGSQLSKNITLTVK